MKNPPIESRLIGIQAISADRYCSAQKLLRKKVPSRQPLRASYDDT
jgi:hypothetical protein